MTYGNAVTMDLAQQVLDLIQRASTRNPIDPIDRWDVTGPTERKVRNQDENKVDEPVEEKKHEDGDDLVVIRKLGVRGFSKELSTKLVNLIRDTKSIMAGSFVVECVTDDYRANDIDIFCSDDGERKIWRDCFPSMKRVKSRYLRANGIVAVYKSKEGINLVFCDNVAQTIDAFDFDLCQASFDGYRFSRHEKVAQKVINILQPLDEYRLYRIEKYRTRGFTFSNLAERLVKFLKGIKGNKHSFKLSTRVFESIVAALDGHIS
jgi:uncharacterized Zn ribbon protein